MICLRGLPRFGCLMTTVILSTGSGMGMDMGVARAEPAAKTHTVVIEAMAFTPAAIEVHAGDTIVWKNKDPFPHTATAQDRSFSSGEIAPDRSWKFKSVRKGRFTYGCTLHTTMQGELIVK